ncbi:MAG: hypothetical protein PHP42_07485 [Bacteroidota bacterium]|nr:hypothetical protein [Bacteroidota bacterium]
MNAHTIKDSPTTGKTYTCVLNEQPLYDATVESTKGCWATVKVVQPLPGKFSNQYKPGQVFDIKVQLYDFIEK